MNGAFEYLLSTTTSTYLTGGEVIRSAPERAPQFGTVTGADLPAPAGYLKIDDIVEDSERIPRRAALLAAARQRLAQANGDQLSPLARARLERGLTQRALADMIGTSQPHVARLEAGGEDLRLSTITKLANALGLPVPQVAEILAATNRHG